MTTFQNNHLCTETDPRCNRIEVYLEPALQEAMDETINNGIYTFDKLLSDLECVKERIDTVMSEIEFEKEARENPELYE